MKKQILVMESEKRAMEILSFVLNRDGYSVIQATDGLAGLRLARRYKPDLIILDLLPPMDSTMTCRCLREAGVSEPILIVTTPKDGMDRPAYMNIGADDCIEQPFAMSELLIRVKMKTLNVDSEPISSTDKSKRQFFGCQRQ